MRRHVPLAPLRGQVGLMGCSPPRQWRAAHVAVPGTRRGSAVWRTPRRPRRATASRRAPPPRSACTSAPYPLSRARRAPPPLRGAPARCAWRGAAPAPKAARGGRGTRQLSACCPCAHDPGLCAARRRAVSGSAVPRVAGSCAGSRAGGRAGRRRASAWPPGSMRAGESAKELSVLSNAVGPDQLVAMTGRAMAIASAMGSPQPSPLVGSTKASAAAYKLRSAARGMSSPCTSSTGGSSARRAPCARAAVTVRVAEWA